MDATKLAKSEMKIELTNNTPIIEEST